MSRQSRRQVTFSSSRLRELRHDRFLTQEEAAQQIGVTLRAYQRWEQGSNDPYFANIRKLAAFFGVDPHDFYVADEVAA